MKKYDFFKITIPNDSSYLPVAQISVKEVAKKFGFSGEDLYKIDLGLEEAFMNVVDHAFEAGESSTFDIICEHLPLGIKIILKEKGIPFDPKSLPSYSPGKNLDEAGSAGLGTHLMKEIMDEVSFHNLGPEGKEMHLVKYLQTRNIKNYFEASELAPHTEEEIKPSVITEKIDFIVRLMQPNEAIEISKGAYKSHGYTFFDEHIYYPDQIVELNKSGEMVSVVAVTPENTFMGHAALHYPSPGAQIAELTFIFVNPEYRSQGCMGRMLELLFETQKDHELYGVYAFAVSNHIFSQKTMLKYGLNDCGIELATSPATWMFKGIDGDESQRMSVVLSFKYLKEPTPLTLYPPARHRAMIEKLYRNIGSKNNFAVPEKVEAEYKEDKSVIETRVYASEGNAEIFIKVYGSNITKEVKAILRELCVENIAAINLFLSLEDPLTYFISSEFEKMDFFFSGIMPLSSIGDALVLQYLNNIAINYDKVIAHSEMAKEILNYIKENDPYSSLT
jgi:anti-sigma regulatory factor (Ser/Thr protein kinase)/RimJ/RimL family protein N-acetyltransferase